jgi:hypothetical protein
LAVAGMQGVVERLLRGCELGKRFLDVGKHVVSDGDDEEGGVGKDPGPACNVFECEATIAFNGDRADFVVLVSYYSRLAGAWKFSRRMLWRVHPTALMDSLGPTVRTWSGGDNSDFHDRYGTWCVVCGVSVV